MPPLAAEWRPALKQVKLKEIGNVLTLDEFDDVYISSKNIEVCTTDAKPSEIFKKIKNNITIIITGDYNKADALLRYIHHYEDDLVSKEDYEYYKSLKMDLNYTAIKRLKMHRLNYILCHNKLPFFNSINYEEDIVSWISEDIEDNYYLLPARRYMRIMTDIKRAHEGIYFDFINATIYICPFVYVPFDKSVPEMFLYFEKFIEGKEVIDVGTGTGILSIIAARLGAKSVTAIDINSNAVTCTRKNIELNNLSHIVIDIKCSDLFNDYKKKFFDTIIFNAPWISGEPKNAYEVAIYDPYYGVIERFLEQSKEHLSYNGTILLQYSDISQTNGDGSMDNLYYLLEKNNLQIIDKKSILRKNRLIGTMERVYLFAIKSNSV